MKTQSNLSKVVTILLILSSVEIAKAQASFVGHGGFVPATDWCGWSAASTIPFNLQHRGTRDINFFTGGNAPAFQRMTIKGTAAGPTAGFVGIGAGFTAPQNLLHLNAFGNNTGQLFRTDGSNTVNNNWQLFTGANSANTVEKFRISSLAFSFFTPGQNDVSISTMQNGSLLFNTNNSTKCAVTTNAMLNNSIFSPANGTFNGDGLRVVAGIGSAAFAALDLFTTGLNQTHIRMDGTALIQTASSRFEQYANLNGFWFNATGNSQFGVPNSFTPQFIFNIQSAEKGRLGSNGFWRFGNNAGAINANNNVEIVSQASSPYGGVIALNGASGLRLTNLTSAKTPLVGINGINPLKVLTVDQNGDVVLTTAAGVTNADNGLSTSGPTANFIHLGQNIAAAGNPGRLLNNRWVPMNNFNISFRDAAVYVPFNNRIELGNINPTIINAPVGSYNPKFASCNIDNTVKRTAGYFSTVYDLTTNIGPVPIQILPFYFGNLGGSQKFGIVSLGIDSTGGRAVGVSGFGYTSGGAGGPVAVGVSGKAFSKNSTQTIYGMQATTAGNAVSAFGISATTTSTGQVAVGGFFSARDANQANIGVAGSALNPALSPLASSYMPGAYIGVYGHANKNSTTGGPLNSFAGYFDGDVWINSPSVGTGFAMTTSDQQFKTNVDTIGSALKIIAHLKPKHFYYDTLNNFQLFFSGKKQYGLIAQDVQTVLPELVSQFTRPAIIDSAGNVSTPSKSFKTLNYSAFIAILMKGVQEQQGKIDSLKSKTTKQDSINNALQTQINNIITTFSNCCSNSSIRTTSITGNSPNSQNTALNQLDVQLSDKDVITLSQNVPNPYAEQTTITYNVPAQYGFAQIIFKTVDGKIIKAVDITKKGKGQLNVFASDLSQGLYMYTLIVDGKVIDTKKMIKE